MKLRDVDLMSVGPSIQKLWPTTFFGKKMPCILHYNTKKISNTIYRQVSDQAQLPDVLKFSVDKESNPTPTSLGDSLLEFSVTLVDRPAHIFLASFL